MTTQGVQILFYTAKSPALSIGLAIQLKVFQQLHYFVPFEELP